MVNWKKRGSKGLATTLIGIVGVILLAGGLVFGQNFSGAISGFVRDSTGAVIPGTTVTAKHTETGLTRSVQTGEEGSYTMPALPVGDYEVTAEKPGFKAQVRQGITLVVAQELVVNLALDVGNLAEKITVTEETQIVNTTLSSVSGLINQQQVKDLPLNGRSYNDFDSRPFFASSEGAPPFKRNQFGGSLGGPLRRDKMFIFGTYEAFRERRNDETTAIVPSAQARLGLLPCNVIKADTRYRDFNCGGSAYVGDRKSTRLNSS